MKVRNVGRQAWRLNVSARNSGNKQHDRVIGLSCHFFSFCRNSETECSHPHVEKATTREASCVVAAVAEAAATIPSVSRANSRFSKSSPNSSMHSSEEINHQETSKKRARNEQERSAWGTLSGTIGCCQALQGSDMTTKYGNMQDPPERDCFLSKKLGAKSAYIACVRIIPTHNLTRVG